MASKITIFDKAGQRLTQLEAETTPRSWVLNGYGRCEFVMPIDDPKCTLVNLQFGNLIFIEHIPTTNEDGSVNGKLRDWVGIILTPRTWDTDEVHVTAYSAEAIYAYRALPYLSISDTPVGTFLIIQELAWQATYPNPPLVGIGGLYGVDQAITYTDDFKTNAYDHMNKMCKFTGMEWDITGKVVGSQLTLHANLYSKKYDRRDLVLTTLNTEVANPRMTEQGTPINQIFAYTHAATDADRTMQEVIYSQSYNDYGPFQTNSVFLGQYDAASILASSSANLATRGLASKILRRTVVNVGDAFDHIAVGSVLTIEEPNIGFNREGALGLAALVRILSVDYNDKTDKAALNIEVIYA